MKFALFYEIPVPKPWGPDDEYEAYQNTITQAVAGEKAGFHAFWTVEHHFLDEYSHCSNPEVLYGAIAAKTERMRLGYGVRLMPKPYNHPVRTAESVAVLDLISNGRVDFGTGRSSTRAELEGFDIDVETAREQWAEAIGHVVDLLDQRRGRARTASTGRCPSATSTPSPARSRTRRSSAPPAASPVTTRWARPASACARSRSGVPPEELIPRIENYRRGQADCVEPLGAFRNEQVATFTMVLCAPTDDEADAAAEESFTWYPAGRRPPDRQRRRVAPGEGAGPRHLRVRRRRQEAGRRRDARPAHLRLHPGLGLGGGRRPGALPGDGQALRGGRRRPPPLPGEPVQDLPRAGHADHRAHGRARHTGLPDDCDRDGHRVDGAQRRRRPGADQGVQRRAGRGRRQGRPATVLAGPCRHLCRRPQAVGDRRPRSADLLGRPRRPHRSARGRRTPRRWAASPCARCWSTPWRRGPGSSPGRRSTPRPWRSRCCRS